MINHEIRRTGIGGSQIAALLPDKYRPYLFSNQTPLALYHYIKDGIGQKDNPSFKDGREMEAMILDAYEEMNNITDEEDKETLNLPFEDNDATKLLLTEYESKTNLKLQRDVKMTSKVNSIFKCQMDGYLPDKRLVVDAKTTRFLKHNLWKNDGIPPGYIAQLQWCMGISDSLEGHIICRVLDEAKTTIIRKMKRSDKVIKSLQNKAVKFWNEHIIPGIPPKPLNHYDHINFANVRFIDIDKHPQIASLCQEFRELDIMTPFRWQGDQAMTFKEIMKQINSRKTELGEKMETILGIKKGEKYTITRLNKGKADRLFCSYWGYRRKRHLDISILKNHGITKEILEKHIYEEDINAYRVRRNLDK